MQFLLAMLISLLPYSQPARTSGPWRSDQLAVRAVVSGDTIDVATLGRVKLLGISAPAISRAPAQSAPFARDARERLASLVLNRFVRLETDGEPLRAGRGAHAAYVFTGDGQFVNVVLVREGLARVAARLTAGRADELTRAERDAQSAKRGIWGTRQVSPPGYTPPPTRSR